MNLLIVSGINLLIVSGMKICKSFDCQWNENM